MNSAPPTERRMYRALKARDPAFEGVFYFAVKTTGIFCRPTCRAKRPKPENVVYFAAPEAAIGAGYRPCKICSPQGLPGEPPSWVCTVLNAIEAAPGSTQPPLDRLSDREIRAMGIDPARLRRWFKLNYKTTFQSYLRSVRLSRAASDLARGKKVVDVAMDRGYESLSGFADAYKKARGTAPRKTLSGESLHVAWIATPLGPILGASTSRGVCLLEFSDRVDMKSAQRIAKKLQGAVTAASSPHLKKLQTQLTEYFRGQRDSFTVPLDLLGTPFQKRAWKALSEIPYAQTRSYAEQAAAMGQPSAVRAVARANGQNRIAILLPCHRVVGSNGTLTGYAAGIWRKAYLLRLERAASSR